MTSDSVNASIQSIAYSLPKQVITNGDLHNENPQWDMKLVAERSGVLQRHIATDNETALDLAFDACQKLFTEHPQIKNSVEALIFCTQTPDYIMPSNSYLLHGRLDLAENVLAFDMNQACSGFIYGLALAKSLINAGTVKNVLLVTGDTYSKLISKQDRSARVLFGDGVAATWITNSPEGGKIGDLVISSAGKHHEKFIVPAGACRLPKSIETSKPMTDKSGNVRTLDQIHMDGMGILTFVNSKVPQQILSLLKVSKLTVDDIDQFVFHQASKTALESLTRILNLKKERCFSNLAAIGNTVSASIPIALSDALDQKVIKTKSKVLVCGFGVGLSWGSALLDF